MDAAVSKGKGVASVRAVVRNHNGVVTGLSLRLFPGVTSPVHLILQKLLPFVKVYG